MNEVFLLLRYTFGGYTLIFILLIGLIIAYIVHWFDSDAFIGAIFIGGILLLVASILLTIFNIEFELLPLLYLVLAVCTVIVVAFIILESIRLAREERKKAKRQRDEEKQRADEKRQRDEKRAIEVEKLRQIEEKAEQGDMNAQYECGLIYKKKRKYNKALDWLYRAEEQGHSNATEKIEETYIIKEKAEQKKRIKVENPPTSKPSSTQLSTYEAIRKWQSILNDPYSDPMQKAIAREALKSLRGY
ncbi:MAG: hypothetical protein LBC71_04955 [Oscillospiraceae bacterium]|nr:hypothetical protein [Oscillospiraceae bacterium]